MTDNGRVRRSAPIAYETSRLALPPRFAGAAFPCGLHLRRNVTARRRSPNHLLAEVPAGASGPGAVVRTVAFVQPEPSNPVSGCSITIHGLSGMKRQMKRRDSLAFTEAAFAKSQLSAAPF